MVIKGILELSPNFNTVDYQIFEKGNIYNLTEKLNLLLMDKVSIIIQKFNDIILCEEGKLTKIPIGSNKLYQYFINSKNFDKVLWNNVGNLISIEIKSEEERDIIS